MPKTTPAKSISDASVIKATGRPLKDWFRILDKAGAKKWIHKDIARFLYEKCNVPGWWSQMVTVQYEYARKKRVVGETVYAGFEIGAQNTIAISKKELWDFLMSPQGVKIWLGASRIEGEVVKPGITYRTGKVGKWKAITGEIRTMKSGLRIRLTWQPVGQWKRSSTLQLTTAATSIKKTSLNIHQEQLPDAKTREVMRTHWQGVLVKIEKAVRHL